MGYRRLQRLLPCEPVPCNPTAESALRPPGGGAPRPAEAVPAGGGVVPPRGRVCYMVRPGFEEFF